MPDPVPHVRVRQDALEIDGRPTFLFGGEVQYFRVRDVTFDAGRTWKLWSDRLDQLKAAGANFVSTYLAWDYHAPGPGRWDFEGARDVGRFLEIAAEKGFWLCVKPGPLILAEWPEGFGSFGAVPRWWTRAHPESIARTRWGEPFRWHPAFPSLGPGRNALPSLAAEGFRADTERWFAAAHEQFARFIGPGRPIVALQLDNEVNLYWQDLYDVDFHPAALARFRERLRAKYGTPAALSDAWGRRWASFDEVRPPRRGRGRRAAHRDWIEHQHELVADWVGFCRAAWGRLGVNEPQVLFLTNDTHATFPARDLLLPHGPSKNRVALHALDTYPRGFPIPRPRRVIYDRPYEPDVATKLIDAYGDLHLGPSRFAFGIEIQGGHFQIPFRGKMLQPHTIEPESTTQTWLRVIAHGMKAVAVYVVVGGLNLDGTPYDFQAAIGLDGRLHARYRGLRAVARLIRAHETELLGSQAVESRVGLCASAAALGPGYGHLGEQRIWGDELRACFGWLAQAGFTPRVLDVEMATDAELCAFRTLLFPSSGEISEAAAARLERFVAAGGTLVQALAPGRLARSLFPAVRAEPPRRFFAPAARGDALFSIDGVRLRTRVPLRDVPRVLPPADAERLAWVEGEEPAALAYSRRWGAGRAVFLGQLPTEVFGEARLFDAPPPDLERRTLLLRRLLLRSGERRLVALDRANEECHIRRARASGALFLFVFTFRDAGRTAVRLRDLDALGVDAAATYVVDEVFDLSGGAGRRLGTMRGEELRDRGIALEMADRGATVLRVAPGRF